MGTGCAKNVPLDFHSIQALVSFQNLRVQVNCFFSIANSEEERTHNEERSS